jgi:hypothetical protein
MDREALEKHLLQVNADLALGRECIGRQRQIVADLEQSGQDTKTAVELLQEAEASQALYATEADRLAMPPRPTDWRKSWRPCPRYTPT